MGILGERRESGVSRSRVRRALWAAIVTFVLTGPAMEIAGRALGRG